MTVNRRKFLRSTGFIATGLALGASSCGGNNEKENEETTAAADTTKAPEPAGTALAAFGLQLYTLRDDLPKDPKGVMKQAASYGYKQFEGFEGKEGMFWGMKHTDFKKFMDEIGVNFVSSHCDINKDFEKKAAMAAEIGMKYLICPYIGPQKSMDDYKKYAEKFNACGDICKKNGIRFAYHNHDYSFTAVNGVYPQDLMMEATSADTVDYEMDIYWVVTAGQDPEAWMKKYANRFRLVHVKDREKSAPAGEHDASCILGTGSIDYKKILKTGTENGVEFFVVEQEKYANSTPLKSAEADATYLKNLLI